MSEIYCKICKANRPSDHLHCNVCEEVCGMYGHPQCQKKDKE